MNIGESINYTYYKFKPLWYYTLPYVLVVFVVRQAINVTDFSILKVIRTIFEGALLVRGNNVAQLWYLVALQLY